MGGPQNTPSGGAAGGVPPAPDVNTLELLGRARAGKDVWGQFYDRYADYLEQSVLAQSPQLVFLHDRIEDVVHDVFLDLQQVIAAYKYEGEHSFRRYLKTIVLNRFRDERDRVLRRNDRALDTQSLARASDGQASARQESPGEPMEALEEIEKHYRCLNRLSEDDRELIIMRDTERKDWSLIGSLTGCHRSVAKQRYVRAWDRLNRLLSEHRAPEPEG